MATIDERVVEMRLDSTNLEKNAKSSIATIDELKQALNFDKLAEGLEKGFAVKFSAMTTMVDTAVRRLTNSIMNFGTQTMKAFTTDPIRSGLAEYETQINATQTILSNTRKEGATIEDVNKALNELNTYADKTIYNFTEMTRNIGTFTAAGVKLETSVAAIKGIANLAAVSGSTSQQASTAMYQLSQALASGTVRLQDWNSVVNAGMGGQVFQDALIETARVHGIAIDDMIKKEGSFRETLSKGWLSAQVMTETLAKFTGDLNREELLAIGYTNEQAEAIIKMGEDANNAATKVKTFSQLMDTLKEAAQSGWTQTWQYIIGDFEEARELWTGVSDVLSEVIQKSADSRNDILKIWKDLGGREEMIRGIAEALRAVGTMIEPIRRGVRLIFPKAVAEDAGKNLFEFTKRFREFFDGLQVTSKRAQQTMRIFRGIAAVFDTVRIVAVQLLDAALGPLFNVLGIGVNIFFELAARIGDAAYALRSFVKDVNLVKGAAILLGTGLEYLANAIDILLNLPLVDTIISTFVTNISNAYKTFKPFFEGLTSSVNAFITRLKAMDQFSFSGLLNAVAILVKDLAHNFGLIEISLNGVVKAFNKGVDWIRDALISLLEFGNRIAKSLHFDNMFGVAYAGVIVVAILAIRKAFNALGETLEAFTNIAKSVTGVAKSVKGVLNSIRNDINAKAFKTLAEGILILAGALAVLTLVDTKKLAYTAGILGSFAVAVGALGAILSKLVSAGKMTINAVGLASSIAILSSAVVILASGLVTLSKINSKDIFVNVFAMGLLATEMGTAAVLISKFAPKLSTGSLFLLSFASSMKILISAINDIQSVDINSAIATVGLAVVLVGALAGLAAVCKKTKEITDTFGIKSTVKSGADSLGLIAMVTSLYLLVGVIKKLGKMNLGEIRNSMNALIPIVGLFASLMVASKFAGKYANEAGKALLAVSASMIIMGVAIRNLAGIEGGELSRASSVIEKILVVFGGITLVTNFAGQNAKKAGSAILAMSAAIALLVVPIMALGGIDDGSLRKALLAVDNVAIIFSVLVASTKFATDAKKTVIALTASIGILAAALTILAVIDPEGLAGATAAIDSLVLSFAVLAASTKFVKKAEPTLVMMTACVGILGIILSELCKLPMDNALEVSLALSVLLEALAGAMLLVSKVGFVSPSVISSAAIIGAAIDVFVVIVGALVGVAGLLARQEGVLTTFQSGIDLLQTVGQAIGEFIGGAFGGLVSGAMKSVSSALPQLGQDLSSFMNEMGGFFEGAEKIDSGVLEGVSRLASVILTLTAANVLDGLTGWLTGGRNLVSFGNELKEFGPKFKDFANDMSQINDVEAIKAAAGAAQVVADFAKAIPNTGGVLAALIGDNTLSRFGTELERFGPGFVSFADEIQSAGINTDVIASVAKSAEAVAAFANQIPNSGLSVMSMLVGDNTLSEFGSQLAKFTPGFILFAKGIQLAHINTDTVDASIAVAKSLTELASSIPNSGGVLADWFGDNNIGQFGEDLNDFGYWFVRYSKKMEEVSPDVLARTTSAADALVDLANKIPQTKGIFEVFTGTNDIASFGKRLFDFGNGIKNYSDVVSTVSVNQMDLINVTLLQLVKTIKELASVKAESLAMLPYKLEGIGNALVNLFTTEINFGYFKMEESAKYLVDGLLAGVAEKKEGVRNSAKRLANAFIESFDDTAAIHSPSLMMWLRGKFLDEGIAKGAEDNMGVVTDSAENVANTFVSTVDDNLDDTYSTGAEAANSVARGANSQVKTVEAAGESTAGGFLRGLANKLKTGGFSGAFSGATFSEGLKSVLGLEKGLSSHTEELTKVSEEISKTVTESMSGLTSQMNTVGSSSMNSLSKGIKENKSPEEAAKEKADAIRKIFEDSMSKFDLNTTTANLEYDLWKAVNEKNANEGQLAAAQLANTAQQLQNQAEKLDLARQEYDKITSEFGKGSTQEQEAYNRFLQQQISYQNLKVQLSEQQKVLTEANANVIAQEQQKQRSAQQTYNSYMRENANMLLKQGFTMQEIQDYAKKISGYDPAKMLQINQETLSKTITGNAQAIQTTWSSAAQVSGETMKEQYTEMGYGSALAFGTGLQNGSNIPITETLNTAKECSNVIGDQKVVWSEGGFNMAGELAAGILENSPAVLEATRTVCQNALNQAMASLGVGSGSDAMSAQKKAQQAGSAIANRFAGGFMDEDYEIYNATGEISQKMLEEALSYAEMINQAVQDKLDGFEPLITPVIDMSDAQGTLDAIDDYLKHATSASFDLGESDRISQDISSRGYLGIMNSHENDESGGDGGGDVYVSFTQNNYSPESISESDTYRNTENQLSAFEERISQDIGGRSSGAWD